MRRVSLSLTPVNACRHVLGCESGLRSIIPDKWGIRQSLMQLHYLVMISVTQVRCRQRIAIMCVSFSEGLFLFKDKPGCALGEAEMKDWASSQEAAISSLPCTNESSEAAPPKMCKHLVFYGLTCGA